MTKWRSTYTRKDGSVVVYEYDKPATTYSRRPKPSKINKDSIKQFEYMLWRCSTDGGFLKRLSLC